jgi:MFS family permease
MGLALLALTGLIETWQILVAATVGSVAKTFHLLAYNASIPLLAPLKHLNRANGMVMLTQGAAMCVAPLLAGVLIESSIGIGGVLLINAATFVVATVPLFWVHVPRPKREEKETSAGTSLAREALEGWYYLRCRSGLIALLVLFCFVNFLMGFMQALFIPLLRGLVSPRAMGLMLSIGGFGTLCGGLAVFSMGVPKRKVRTLVGTMFLAGLAILTAGLRPSILLVGAAVFVMLALVPIITATNQIIWQTKTALHFQGRVFALRRMVATCVSPIGVLLAGPLADRVFEPLLARGGPLTGSLGLMIGVGPGRGTALMFILLGAATCATTVLAYQHPRLRHLEEELLDAIHEPPAGTGEPSCPADVDGTAGDTAEPEEFIRSNRSN